MINEMLDFLNDNAGALTVLFSFVVACSTVIYAVLTAKLVGETRKMRNAQTEPRVEIVIKPDESLNLFHVHVKNIGLGPAYDVLFGIRMESGGLVAQSLIDDFMRSNFFKTGIKYLGPGQEVVSDSTPIYVNYDQKMKSVLIFEINYKNSVKKIYNDSFCINFSEFEGMTVKGESPFFQIAGELRQIRQKFDSLTFYLTHTKRGLVYRGDKVETELEIHENEDKDLKRNVDEWWVSPKD